MKPLTPFERKLSRYAIPDLTLYLVGGQALALALGLAMPQLLFNLQLIPAAVMAGQWWRVLSFLFTPPSGNPIFAVFALYLLYFMGGALEAHWGTVRYNIYLVVGYAMTVLLAFLVPAQIASNVYLTTSIFLAFAWLFPDYQIYLFFVLPVRIKWLALLTWAMYGYQLIFGNMMDRLLILAALANFLLFFGQDIALRVRQGHRTMQRQSSAIRQRDQPMHVCAVCGITNLSHREMDFRYCTKCDPPVAYCSDHLFRHSHVGQKSGQG